MYAGAISHDRIINAFQQHVPSCYVRDYHDKGGYITLFRGTRDIRWNDQATAGNVYRQVPAETLCSIPRGFMTAATHYRGLALDRPGWRIQFRKASKCLSDNQMRRITKTLGLGEVFPGIL